MKRITKILGAVTLAAALGAAGGAQAQWWGSPMGGAPWGGSPWGGSPWGGSPWGGSPWGGGPMGGGPWGAYPGYGYYPGWGNGWNNGWGNNGWGRGFGDLRFSADGSLYVLVRNAWVIDDKFEGATGALLRIRPLRAEEEE